MSSDDTKRIRRNIVKAIHRAGSGHYGGSLSCVEILQAIFEHKSPQDKFVLSKGHAAPALYAVMAEHGIIPTAELGTLRELGSRLQGHPDRTKLIHLDAGCGALGQGLSIAAGYALAAQFKARPEGIAYCLVGDGECQEGQIWEAARSAAEMKLNNLTCFIDCNNFQNEGELSRPHKYFTYQSAFEAFGWFVKGIDGHNKGDLEDAMRWSKDLRVPAPKVIIAQTVKGKGVSFMENDNHWHGGVMSVEQYAQALEELK